MTYKAMKYLATIAVMLVAVSCQFQGFENPNHTPSSATFSVGATVSGNTAQQFLSLTTEGDWSLTIDYPTEGENWCTLSPTSGTGNTNVMMSFGKNEGDGERSAVITVRFDDTTLHLDFVQRSTFSLANNTQMKGWAELPEFADDRQRYYFTKHMLPSSKNVQRSYSALYDAQNNIPIWVAYPLCKSYMEGNTRTNQWGPKDPNIPADKQPDMSLSYQGSYDRGHMLPSASRDNNGADNNQTYYPSNITPQLDRLNQAKWANAENLVRSWAEGCDTLYVVTGAVLQTAGGNESISYTYAKRSPQMDVAIPNYYYKALLQYNEIDGQKVYQAIGIWMEHKAASGAVTTADLITIDKLEEKLGYDLFANIDPTIQSQIEAKYNLIYWNGIEN